MSINTNMCSIIKNVNLTPGGIVGIRIAKERTVHANKKKQIYIKQLRQTREF